MTTRSVRSFRRLFLGGAVLAAMAAPMIAGSGCGGGLDSISKIDALRVLTVVPAVLDKDHPTFGTEVTGSYARPGDEVTFSMISADGLSPDGSRPTEVLWLAGCYDPPGDAYYGCYAQLADVLRSADPTQVDDTNFIGHNPTFKTTIPADIVSRRIRPVGGPYYGIAYVFFALCAGHIEPVIASGTGKAGDFPLGCFNDKHQQLGADSFVPGYTQVYVFDDGRLNANPRVQGMSMLSADGLSVTHTTLLEGSDKAPTIARCGVSDDDRDAPPSCSKPDPTAVCKIYTIDVDVKADVAELDPDSSSADGAPLKEVVWVDYFADKGDFDTEVKLVSDATTGLIDDHSSKYIPPTESGLVTMWAVVHDARGGSTLLTRYLRVE